MTFKKGANIQQELQDFQYQQEMVAYPENEMIGDAAGKTEDQLQLEELERLNQYYLGLIDARNGGLDVIPENNQGASFSQQVQTQASLSNLQSFEEMKAQEIEQYNQQ